MRKFTVFFIIVTLLLAGEAGALSPASSFVKRDVRISSLWRDFLYIPVFDVTLPTAPAGGDTLNALTLKNLGTAKAGSDISLVRVWRDDGDTLFDSRFDTELGVATWDGVNSWDGSGLSGSFSGSIQIFITIDTSSTATADRTIRFAIPQLSDVNGNGGYDAGDEGVFFASSNDGPSDYEIANGRTDTFALASKCENNKTGPRSPSGVSAQSTANSGELNIAWQNPTDVDFFSITINRSQTEGFLGNVVYSGVTGTSTLDTGLADGMKYYYTLRAVDICNNESLPAGVASAAPGVVVPEPTPVPTPEPALEPTPEPVLEPILDPIIANGPSGRVRDGNRIAAPVIPSTTAAIGEGDLVRGEDGIKVYVVKGGRLRWIQSPAIMDMYGHFQWLAIKEVSDSDLGKFYESSLVRAVGDTRIYEIDAQGAKRWLNMTAAEFEARGYQWDAVYEVNEAELGWYR